MTNFIQIGGRERPVRFGMAGLYEYEQRTGRKALTDFKALAGGLESVSITLVVDLIFCGLACGARTESQNMDFTTYDVADWLAGDNDTLQKVMDLFAESFPQDGGKKTLNGSKAAKKAATPTAL